MQKYFSIIIPTLNEEKNLPVLLTDLKNQTFIDFEVIHVDGQSEDKTTQVTQQFSEKIDIKTVTATKRNVCYQRNLGSQHATGKWLIFMDADVQIKSTFLSEIHKKLSLKNHDIFITFYDPNINKIKYKILTSFINFLTFFSQKSELPFVTESVFGIKSEIYRKLGGFDETIKVNEGKFFVNIARKQGYTFSIFRTPKYLNSMRRAEKMGLLQMLKNNFVLASKIIAGKQMKAEDVEDLYKMDGGSSYK